MYLDSGVLFFNHERLRAGGGRFARYAKSLFPQYGGVGMRLFGAQTVRYAGAVEKRKLLAFVCPCRSGYRRGGVQFLRH